MEHFFIFPHILIRITLSGRENMSSFNVSEYNSYILIYNENTSSGKWPTHRKNNTSLRKPISNRELSYLITELNNSIKELSIWVCCIRELFYWIREISIWIRELNN